MSESGHSPTPRGEKRQSKRGSFVPYTPRPKSAKMSESAETTAQSEPAADGKDRFGATSSLPSGGESEHSGGHAYHPEPVSPAYAVKKRLPFDAQYEQRRLVVLVCLLLFTLWAYWPAITGLVRTWTVFVDYSHAFFVLPLTLFFLWGRRDTYPGTGKRFAWLGLAPILLSMTMRWHATNYDEESIENWSILFWVLGMVWFLYGTRTFRWALPSLLFLCFLFPLPYRFEVEFRQFLQEYASLFGTMLLQLVGEPAVQIQNTIQVGDTVVSVAAACSGLRFLISFFALAHAK